MKTICLDPVSAALLTTRRDSCPDVCMDPTVHPPFLSFVTVDRPPPTAKCERVMGHCCFGGCDPLPCGCCRRAGLLGHNPPAPWIGQRVAIYADTTIPPTRGRLSGLSVEDYDNLTVTLDAIVGSGTLAEALPIYDRDTPAAARATGRRIVLVRGHPMEPRLYLMTSDENTDISDQLPLQDWSPGRWALRFTDVAPTHDTRHDAIWCLAAVAPVLSGDDPTYREWTHES